MRWRLYCLPPTSNVIGGALKPAAPTLELPQFLQRGVVIGRDRAVGQADEHEAAGGSEECAADVRIAQVDYSS